jgi:hypothetical protein
MASRAALLAVCVVACATEPGDHDEASDFDPVDWSPNGKADFGGVPATFDRNLIMDDVVFGTAAVDTHALQAFLEHSPYGTRSWLADAQLDGMRFSDDVYAIAHARNIDPVVLLARMQVESSLVSATVRPSNTRINTALGCGCPDSSGCSSAYTGLSGQLNCAADVLAGKYGESTAGTGAWRKGHTSRTSDPLNVTPSSNATAALYAYTPWVLEGRGGNWLVWNVTRKFLKHFDEAGTLHLP